MRNNRVIKNLIYILAMFIAMIALFVIFPNSNVKAANLILELDKQNGMTDKGRAPYGAQFAVDDVVLAAQKGSDSLYFAEKLNAIAGRKAADKYSSGQIYEMANAACIDAHDYGMYGNYDISVFYISAVIDVNIDGDGSIKVYKGSGSTTIQADSAAGKYLYAASYLAASGAYKYVVSDAVCRAYHNTSVLPDMLRRIGVNSGYDSQISTAVKNGYLRCKGRFVVFDGVECNGTGSRVLQSQIVFAGKKINTTIKLRKTDENGKVLKGAKFKIYNKTLKKYINRNGNLVSESSASKFSTTTEDGKYTSIRLSGLPIGKYVAYEVTAPNGYKKITKAIPLKTNRNWSDSNDYDVAENEEEKQDISLEIYKYDSDSKQALAGAKFIIKNKDTGKYLSSSYSEVSKSSAYQFTTDSSGKISIAKINKANYVAYEVDPPAGYIVTNTSGITMKQNGITKISNKPKPQGFSIIIRKYDSSTGSGLANAYFKFKDTKTGKYLSSSKTLVDESQAGQFRTDSNGEINLDNVPEGTYVAYEVVVPTGYKLYYTNGVSVTLNQVTEVPNIPDTPDTPEPPPPVTVGFGIYKYDSLDSRAISGAGFIIMDSSTGKYLNSSLELVDRSEAYTFVTDYSGRISIDGAPEGNYIAYEVSVPYGYRATTYGSISISSGNTTSVSNSPILIDIEGTVFLDGGEGKTSARNDKFDSGEGINGVRVILKKNGNKVAEVSSGYNSRGSSTGSTGKYRFYGQDLKIRLLELSQYTIEFEYNGIKYENVATSFSSDGSKAAESSGNRSNLNQKFSTITANSQIDGSGISVNNANGGDTVEYQYRQYPSEGRYESKVLYKANASDDRGNAYNDQYYANSKYHITANTSQTRFRLDAQSTSNDTVYNVNFGIYERDLPDMAIKNQLYAAEVALTRQDYGQTYSHVYKYNRNDDYNIKIRVTDAYNTPLVREIYSSDASYNKQNPGALNVYLTYKINIRNQNTSITTTVGDIVNYFDNGLTIEQVGTSATINQSSGTVSVNGNVSYNSLSSYNGQYNKVNIPIGSNEEIYVRYKVSQAKLVSMLNGNVNIAANVAEINSCTAKKNGSPYTAIDNDSAVGNADPSRRLQTVEDDLGWAPDVTLKLSANERKTTGVVFEDHTDAEFKEGQERKGDGRYTDQDTKKVSGVKVSLIDIGAGMNLGNPAQGYGPSGSTVITDTTGSDGTYELGGFLPGNYIVVFQYGDDTYPVQQYQATIYDSSRLQRNYDGQNGYWYLDGTRYSDAIDVYDSHNEYYNLPNDGSSTRKEIENTWAAGYADGKQHIRYNTEINSTLTLDAFTPCMVFRVEKDDTVSEEDEEEEEETIQIFTVSDVDFGIVERPRYKVQVDNVINKITLKTSEGSVLKEIIPSADMNVANVKYMPSTGRTSKTDLARKGFVEMEIDMEILQRAQLFVEYGFNITNKSELEYNTKAYYRSGTPGRDANIVRTTVTNMIDYVDNGLSFDKNSKMLTDENATNEGNKWAVMKWSDANKWLSDNVRSELTSAENPDESKYTTVLIGEGFGTTQLKPGEKTTVPVKLLLDKSLAPTQEDMRYSNWAEIVEVTKNWGREIYADDTSNTFGEKLGNFNPEKPDPSDTTKKIPGNNKEPDYHYPEDIVIHPPTGVSGDMIKYSIIGVVALAILAGGIVIIKKKVS